MFNIYLKFLFIVEDIFFIHFTIILIWGTAILLFISPLDYCYIYSYLIHTLIYYKTFFIYLNSKQPFRFFKKDFVFKYYLWNYFSQHWRESFYFLPCQTAFRSDIVICTTRGESMGNYIRMSPVLLCLFTTSTGKVWQLGRE